MPLGINESISQVASRCMSAQVALLYRDQSAWNQPRVCRARCRRRQKSPIMTLVSDAHPQLYDNDAAVETGSWRAYVPEGVRPYMESAPLAALFLGISSGAAFAMIGATLTTRLAQYGIRKS